MAGFHVFNWGNIFYNILWVLSVQHYNLTSVYITLCSPPKKGLVSILHYTVDPLYPFHPSPMITTNLLSVFMSLFFFYLFGGGGGFIFHTWVKSYDICLRLISISIIPSRFIRVFSNGRVSCFLWHSNITLYVYVCACVCVYTHIYTTSLFIHPLMNT